MKQALDYLAPATVLAGLAAIAARPSWVSVAVFAVAIAFFALERLVYAHRVMAEAAALAEAVTAKYAAEVEALRKETKGMKDALSHFTSAASLNRKVDRF